MKTNQHTHSYDKLCPLTMAPVGQEVRLCQLCSGRRMARRLAELGLTPGVCLRVVQDAGGPLLLSVRNSRVAVGRGIADKLQVELIHEGEQRDDEFAGSDTGTTVTEKPAATPSAGGQLGRQGRWSHLGRRRRRHEEAGSHSHWSQG